MLNRFKKEFESHERVRAFIEQIGWEVDSVVEIDGGPRVIAEFRKEIGGVRILAVDYASRAGLPVTLVMAEGCVQDVATYRHEGHVAPEIAARDGLKLTEIQNQVGGFPVPEGRRYRQ